MTKKVVGPIGPLKRRPLDVDEATGDRTYEIEIPYEDFLLTLEAVISPDRGVVFSDLRISETESVTSGMMQRIRLGLIREVIGRDFVRNPLWWGTVGVLTELAVESVSGIEWAETPSKEQMAAIEAERKEVQRLSRLLKDYQVKRGRAAENPGLYRMVAELYLQLLPEHGQRVIEAMTTELGKPKNTVSGWVQKSRDNRWLTPAPAQGRAGGEAGPRLIEWRKEKE